MGRGRETTAWGRGGVEGQGGKDPPAWGSMGAAAGGVPSRRLGERAAGRNQKERWVSFLENPHRGRGAGVTVSRHTLSLGLHTGLNGTTRAGPEHEHLPTADR